MLEVVIVEDEPAAARYLKALVEGAPGRFTVRGTAGNGRDGLDLVRRTGPDVVLTDVRMPVLDGLGLAGALRAEFPELPVVIVSGHQEFDYARRALALGVVDYLLKPVDPAALEALLADLDDRAARRRLIRRTEALEAALEGRPAPGPLPARLRLALTAGLELPPDPPEAVLAVAGRGPGLWWLAADAEALAQDQFEAWVRALARPEGGRTSLTVFGDRPWPPEEVPAGARGLAASVDRLRVAGRSRICWGAAAESPPPLLDPLWAQKFRWALQESACRRMEELVRGLVAEGDRCDRSQRQTAGLLRQVLALTVQEGGGGPDPLGRDWEARLAEGLDRADSPDEVADLAWDLVSALTCGGGSPGTGDAPEAHQAIVRWVRTHFAEPLTIAAVCDRFHLSQTSLSRQFRRYEGRSFHEFLTGLRLDAAEALLKDTPGLPLKTVAASVGYPDPFHFSRAFKAAKGLPPSRIHGSD